MLCDKCGAPTSDSSIYCPKCGNQIQAHQEAIATTQPHVKAYSSEVADPSAKNFKNIKTAITDRLTKTNVFFAGIAWIIYFTYLMMNIYVYENENGLALESSSHPGIQIYYFPFWLSLTIFSNAPYMIWSIFLKTLITVGLAIPAIIWLVKFCVIEETHLGWKRISFAFPITCALYFGFGAYLKGNDIGEVFRATEFFLLLGLVLFAVARWIFKGFKSK